MADSALNFLYNDIMAAVVGVVTELKTVDVDLGQLKKGGESMPFDYPALLIKFENVTWGSYDTTKKIGLVHIRLKVIYPFTNAEDYYTAVHTVRDEVSTFYSIIQDVRNAVYNIGGTKHSKLFCFNENHLDSSPEEMKWTYCIDFYCNIFTDLSDFDPYAAIHEDYDTILRNGIIIDNTLKAKKVG